MLYLCEALFHMLIWHLVKIESNPINIKYISAHFKAPNQCFSTKRNSVKILFKHHCLTVHQDISSNLVLPYHLLKTSHSDSRGCRWLLLARFHPFT
jgi:hypothetical protein